MPNGEENGRGADLLVTGAEATPPLPHDAARFRRMFEEAIGSGFTAGNRVERLRNGNEIFPAMLDAIASAERFIELLTYIYWTGDIAWRFARALAEKARQGVPVRLLLDAVGAAPMARDLIATMQEGGVDLRWFRPVARWNPAAARQRTHRKVLVVDGEVGFTGGVGIAQEWCGDARDETEWRDTHFRVRGPALRGLRAAFLGNWAEAAAEDGLTWRLPGPLQVGADVTEAVGEAEVQVVRSTASVAWSEVAAMTELAIALARRGLRIGTAYFTPDEATTAQLVEAVRRGVQVEVMLPWPHMDTRVSQLAGAKEMEPLLAAGVRVHIFQPTMYHTKVMLLDDEVAIVGSANFNRRSAWQDDELCLVCRDAALAARLRQDWEEDLPRCAPLDLKQWRQRGLWERLKERAAGLIRPAV